jgi:hypothetical protein
MALGGEIDYVKLRKEFHAPRRRNTVFQCRVHSQNGRSEVHDAGFSSDSWLQALFQSGKLRAHYAITMFDCGQATA